MPFATGLESAQSSGLQNLSRAFSAESRARARQVESDDGSRRLLQARFRARDAFVRRSAPDEPRRTTALAEPERLFASSTDARLRTSSRTVTREDGDTGSTTTVQNDRLDFRFRSSQLALGEGGVESIANALEGQTEALGRVLDAAGLLGDFNSDFAAEFLNRIGGALEQLAGEDGVRAQATGLDVKIRVQSKSVRIENGEDGEFVERSVQRIDIQVRFVSLSASGEVEEPQGPLEADLRGAKGELRGLGPLAQFDFNGDGRFSIDDVLELADEVIDVG